MDDIEPFQNFVWETYKSCIVYTKGDPLPQAEREMLKLIKRQMIKYLTEMGNEIREED